jgi:hypothetical protein
MGVTDTTVSAETADAVILVDRIDRVATRSGSAAARSTSDARA